MTFPADLRTLVVTLAAVSTGLALAFALLKTRAAQARLEESEERYRNVVDESPDLIYRTDAAGRLTYANAAAARVLGYGREELEGRHFLDLVHPSAREEAGAFYAEQTKSRVATTQFEFPAVTKEGREVWIAQSVQMLLHGDDSRGFEAVARDVTEQKRVERELRDQKRLFEGLVTVARATAEARDLSATLENSLRVTTSLTGAVGGSLFLLDDEGAVARALFAVAEQAITEATVARRLVTEGLAGWVVREGRTALVLDTRDDARWLRLPDEPSDWRSALCVPVSGVDSTLGVLTLVHTEPGHFTGDHVNLIEAAAAQMALSLRNAQESEARLELAREQTLLYEVLEASSRPFEAREVAEASAAAISRHTGWRHVAVALPEEDGYWRFSGVLDSPPESRVPLANGVVGRAFRTGRTQVVENVEADPDYVPSSSLVRSELAVPLRFGESILGVLNLESDVAAAFGPRVVRVAESVADPIALGLENARLYRAIASESARLAASLESNRELEKLRDDLTRTMVHDLRSPLTAILGAVEMVETSPGLSPENLRMLEIANVNAQRQLRLINSILDVSRLESGALPLERSRVGLRDLIVEVVHLLRPRALADGIELVDDVSEKLPDALVDRELLDRVLENLVVNAIKFTPPGGTVRVAGSRLDGRALQVTVSDTGSGVPEEMKPRLFQKFAAGPQKARGTGLGLAFCRLAVEAHGGRVWLESSSASGASFAFTLPLA